MAIARSLSQWLRLPGRVALILGLGALSTAGVRADTPKQGNLATGETQIRSDGGRIFLSEGGRETELRLGETPQRAHLLRLLEEHGPAGVKLDRDPRLIMSGGGGSGFSLRDIQRSVFGDPAPAPRDAQQPGTPKREPTPRNSKTTADKKG